MTTQETFMNILTLDTATDQCSCALSLNGRILSHSLHAPMRHAELILPMVKALLEEAGISLSQIDVIGFGRGPGSFTGVRIAASVTQGLSVAHDIAVAPISNLLTLAQGIFIPNQSSAIFTAIDARKHQIYCAGYYADNNELKPLLAEALLSPAAVKLPPEFQNGVGIGSGFTIYASELAPTLKILQTIMTKNVSEAKHMIPLVEHMQRRQLLVSAESAIPIYLRDKIC